MRARCSEGEARARRSFRSNTQEAGPVSCALGTREEHEGVFKRNIQEVGGDFGAFEAKEKHNEASKEYTDDKKQRESTAKLQKLIDN